MPHFSQDVLADAHTLFECPHLRQRSPAKIEKKIIKLKDIGALKFNNLNIQLGEPEEKNLGASTRSNNWTHMWRRESNPGHSDLPGGERSHHCTILTSSWKINFRSGSVKISFFLLSHIL